jgi:hypothetical protein
LSKREPLTAHDLAIAGFSSGCALVAIALSRHFAGRDFDVFYASALNVARGVDPYVGVGALNTNPPHVVVLMALLTAVPLTSAYWIWTVLSTAAVATAIGIVHRARRAPITLGATAAFLGCSGTFYQLAGGQVAWLLAWPMTVAWLWGSTTGAGVWLGVAASAKPFLLLFVPYLGWRRDWRRLRGMCLGTAAAATFGLAFTGPQAYVSWWRSLARLNTAFHYSNGALYGVVARIAQPTYLFLITPALARAIWLAACAAVATLTIVPLGRGLGRDREWALVVVTALVLSPLGQPYYLVLAIGPLWVTIRDLAWPRWGWGVLGLFWWPNVLTSPDPPTALWRLAFYNLTAVGLISLWAVLAFGKTRGRA